MISVNNLVNSKSNHWASGVNDRPPGYAAQQTSRIALVASGAMIAAGSALAAYVAFWFAQPTAGLVSFVVATGVIITGVRARSLYQVSLEDSGSLSRDAADLRTRGCVVDGMLIAVSVGVTTSALFFATPFQVMMTAALVAGLGLVHFGGIGLQNTLSRSN